MTPIQQRRQTKGADSFRPFLTAIIALTAFLALCGCQHKPSKEETDKAVAAFKGGPPGPDEAQVQAKERATAAEYRKAHPDEFPPSMFPADTTTPGGTPPAAAPPAPK